MRVTSDDTEVAPYRITSRRASLGVLAILLAILAAAVATYVYQQLRLDAAQKQAAMAVTDGNPDRGAALLRNYGCSGCHIIPGIPSARGQVGPDLTGLARRVYVAGVTTNTPEHLMAFIVDPQSVDPKSAMPPTGVTTDEARDIAAYLYASRQ